MESDLGSALGSASLSDPRNGRESKRGNSPEGVMESDPRGEIGNASGNDLKIDFESGSLTGSEY